MDQKRKINPAARVNTFLVGDGIGMLDGRPAGIILESRPSTQGKGHWYLKWAWADDAPYGEGNYDGPSSTTDTRHFYFDYIIPEEPW
jgi:hypothetical protein